MDLTIGDVVCRFERPGASEWASIAAECMNALEAVKGIQSDLSNGPAIEAARRHGDVLARAVSAFERLFDATLKEPLEEPLSDAEMLVYGASVYTGLESELVSLAAAASLLNFGGAPEGGSTSLS